MAGELGAPERKGSRHHERGGRDHHDYRANEGVCPFIVDPAWRDPLVDDVGLLEEQLPRRDRRSHDRDDQEHAVEVIPPWAPGIKNPRTIGPAWGWTRITSGMARKFTANEMNMKRSQLRKPPVAVDGDQPERGDGDRDVRRYAEVAEGKAHADELGDDREGVQDEQVAD